MRGHHSRDETKADAQGVVGCMFCALASVLLHSSFTATCLDLGRRRFILLQRKRVFCFICLFLVAVAACWAAVAEVTSKRSFEIHPIHVFFDNKSQTEVYMAGRRWGAAVKNCRDISFLSYVHQRETRVE